MNTIQLIKRRSRKLFRGDFDALFFTAILYLIVIILNHKGIIDEKTLISIIVGIAASSIGYITLKVKKDEMFKQLFTEFNKRYDELNDFLNNIDNQTKLESKEKEKVINYLMLCAEECMWYKKGRITPEVWENWKSGMLIHLRKSPIKAIYMQEESIKNSYYGLFDEIPVHIL